MKKLDQLTLSEKIGQMLLLAFHGTSYNSQLDSLIKDIKVGGVIHFSRNIGSLNDVYNINKTIQENADIPLFIGLDQEGGAVLRVTEGITPFPGAMSLSATNEDPSKLIQNVGEDLRNLGFNMVFAPVGDVNNNPMNPVINSRSYSDDPEVVAKYATFAFKAFQKAKMLPTIKHFPGHGDTSVDSHLSLPVVKKTKEEIQCLELVPFYRTIKEGIDGVMLSHILYTEYDDTYPASLSYNVTTKLLKQKMGFKGLIVTDSLTMGAIHEQYSNNEIVRLAVNAGVDILIFCGRATLEEQLEIKRCFEEEVANGNIKMERIDESVQKILDYKAKYYSSDCSLDNIHKDYQDAIDLSEKAITLVKDKGLLPLKRNDKVLIISSSIATPGLVKKNKVLENIIDSKQYQTLGEYLPYDSIVVKANEKVNIDCDKYDKIVFLTYNVSKGDYQTEVYNMLDKSKTILISLRSPYDILYMKDVATYICGYEATTLSLENIAKCLTGKRSFTGKLPVNLGKF